MSAARPPRLYPDLARYAYLAPLIAHRRVLLVGDASPERCLPLVGLRARYVCAVDPNPEHVEAARASGHPENLSFQSMPLEALSFRDGSFDLVLAPDLSVAETPAAVVAEAHRVLDARGYFVAVTRNAECPTPLTGDDGNGRNPLSYYDLYELCSQRFPVVTMLGQSPFVGYAVADFTPGEEEPPISFDPSLLPEEGELAEFFCAVGGPDRPNIERFDILQVPSSFVSARSGGAPTDRIAEQLRSLEQAAEAERRQRIELQAAVDQERAGWAQLDQSAAEQRAALEAARAMVDERGIAIQQLEQKLRAADDENVKARERAAQAQKDAEDERKARQKAELDLQIARKSPEAAEAKARAAELDEAVADLREEAARLSGELAEARQSLAQAADAPRVVEDTDERARTAEGEVARLEHELRARAQRVTELEAEVARREILLRDALEQIREARSAAPEAEAPPDTAAPAAMDALRRQIDESERELTAARAETSAAQAELERLDRAGAEMRARLEAIAAQRAAEEADLQHARWRVSELEAALDGWSLKVEAAEQACSTARDDADTRGREVAKLRGTLASMQMLQAALEGERRGLLVRLAEMEETVAVAPRAPSETPSPAGKPAAAELAAQVEAATAKVAAAEARVDETRRSYEEKLTSLVEEADRLRRGRADDGTRLAALDKSLRERDERLARIERDLEDARTKLDRAGPAADGDALGALRLESVKQREAIDRLERSLTERETLMKTLSAQVAERDARIQVLERKIKEDRERAGGTDLAGYKREISARDERVSQLQDELDREVLARRSVELQLQDLKARAGEDTSKHARKLNELLGDRDAEVLLLQARVESGEKELRALRTDIAKARERLDRLMAFPRAEPLRGELGALLALLSH